MTVRGNPITVVGNTDPGGRPVWSQYTNSWHCALYLYYITAKIAFIWEAVTRSLGPEGYHAVGHEVETWMS